MCISGTLHPSWTGLAKGRQVLVPGKGIEIQSSSLSIPTQTRIAAAWTWRAAVCSNSQSLHTPVLSSKLTFPWPTIKTRRNQKLKIRENNNNGNCYVILMGAEDSMGKCEGIWKLYLWIGTSRTSPAGMQVSCAALCHGEAGFLRLSEPSLTVYTVLQKNLLSG